MPVTALNRAKTLAKRLVGPVVEARERRRLGSLYTSLHDNIDPERHLREAAEWLMRAQDAGTDRGVSHGAEFGQGFRPSYPETTGYIICSFLDLADRYKDPGLLTRACEMGDWEAEIQMPSGAVMGGTYTSKPTPAVFNTGMVLLGWAALYKKTHDDRYRRAGERAGRWLLSVQEADGNWIKGNSGFAHSTATVYNVKSAWGLAEMGKALGEESFVSAAVRNAEYALGHQLPNGWYSDCCLTDPERPLLHTIAYTMQGLVGIGRLSGRGDLVRGAARTADSLLSLMEPDGFIPGRIEQDFRGTVDWSCLTGTAQTSIVWSDLAALGEGGSSYREAAGRANRYLMMRHDISSPSPVIRGGMAGSWPVWGEYGQYRILNWATKFFIDALLIHEQPVE